MRRQALVTLAAVLAAAVLGSGGRAQQPPNGPDAGPPIRLHAATFVPTRGEAPAIPPGLAIAGYAQGQRGYYLVQFAGPVLDAWKNDLASIGVEILDYIPEFAFKVRMTPAQAAQARSRPGVAWVGLFHPAYKLGPGVPRAGQALYVVRIERGVDAGPATAAVAATGVQIVERDGSVLTVAASGGQVDAMARVLDVSSIEPFLMRERHNDHGAARIVRSLDANIAGYDGSTQIVAVADTGLGNGQAHDAHIDLAGRVVALHNWPGASTSCYNVTNDDAVDVDSGHGTHVALSAVGSGSTGVVGRGAAPAAGLLFQAVENWAQMKGLCSLTYPSGYYLIGIPSDIRQLFQQAYTGGARVHSNSWGSNAEGAYTIDSVNADNFVWANRDMTIVFSAGNAGVDANRDGIIDADSIGSPATAKNVITVGASENDRLGDWACDVNLAYANCPSQGNALFTYGAAWPSSFPANPIKDDPSAGNPEQMAAFSSRGPTDDGRIKPDVVAPGTWILSGYSDRFQQGYDPGANPQNGAWQYDGWGFPRSQYHKYMGGTSMSAPIVAGAAAVVRDYYVKARSHTTATAALVKANLINSAVDMLDENNSGVNDNLYPIPNIHEGWGRIDLFAAVQAHEFVESTTGLGTGSQQSFTYVVAGGSPLKVTVAWSDAPSTTSASRNLVNDLDLVVTAPGGSVYRGNVFSGGWSQTNGNADRVNNVENVYVASPAAGTWTVQVTGFNVPNGPQPFALVVRGASAGDGGGTPPNTAPTAANVNVSTNEDTPLAITLSGSDAEQCELQFSITGGPSNGSLGAIANAGCSAGAPNVDTAQVTYTPTANYDGPDSFTYRVSDGSLTADATVTITVHAVNDAPVAQDVSASTVVGTPVQVTLQATDVDTCHLTFSIASGPSGGSVGDISNEPCVSGSPNTATALVTYTPPVDAGTYTFTYTANDGVADSNIATVTVTVTAAPGEPPDPTDPADPTHVHVGDLDGSGTNLGRGYWQGTVTIEIHDNNHTPITGAEVSGSWSGSSSGSVSCITNGSGRCSVTTGQIHNSSQTVTWTVTGVSDSLPYESGANHDPDGDSNGTTITVRR